MPGGGAGAASDALPLRVLHLPSRPAGRGRRACPARGPPSPAARVPPPEQIAALQVGPEHNPHFATLYKFFAAQLAALMPPGTNIPEAYSRCARA